MTPRALVAALAVLALAGCASAAPPPEDSGLSVGGGSRVPLTSAATAPSSVAGPVSSVSSPGSSVSSPGSSVSSPASSYSVHGIGDSLMVDSTPNLMARIPGITIDAVVGRPVAPGIAALAVQHDAGTVADVTVFALGTNGPFTAGELSQVIDLTAGHRLVVVTSHCPSCSWTDGNNATVHAQCTAAAHCAIADFAALAATHPQWFGVDQIHVAVGGAGADGYAQAVTAAISSFN